MDIEDYQNQLNKYSFLLKKKKEKNVIGDPKSNIRNQKSYDIAFEVTSTGYKCSFTNRFQKDFQLY